MHPLLDVLLVAILNWLVWYVRSELENRGILPRPTVRYPYLVLIAYHGVPDIELSVPKIPNVGDAIILPPKGPGVAPDVLRVTDVVLESHGSKTDAPRWAATVHVSGGMSARKRK